MNYRHAFHAGNFADVFKHVLFARILAYLAQKPGAFRVIDTHAGDGVYDLAGAAAEKTEEWRQGIGRLLASDAPADAEARALLAPYLGVAAPLFTEERRHYPGSPHIAAALLRRQDRMIFCEAHRDAAHALKAALGRDKRAKIVAIDGFMGLAAYVPPLERRGCVLIDPPYEAPNEFAHIVAALETGLRKWPTGTYVIWHPIKDRGAVAHFLRDIGATIGQARIRDVLRLELWIDAIRPDGLLVGSGLVVVNPPYLLEAEAKIILPYLVKVLAVSADAGHAIARL